VSGNVPAAQPRALGHPRVHLRCTDSTNERARELALGDAPDGTMVSASEQSAGRGRQRRRWAAPAGSSILISLVLRSPPRLLPLMAALAVCDVAGEGARIKWPNDVVLPGSGEGSAGSGTALAKLAGILIEGRPQQGWAVLGIGMNVAVDLAELPPELRPGAAPAAEGVEARPAATLGLGREDVEPTLARLLQALEVRLAESPDHTLEQWRERDALRGREVSWAAGHGRAEGIDGDGRLVVALSDGGHTAIGSGEVHLERIG
jgi:BirA family biotin operon repressor/biotin-[acetyl-CoA-carboxylase] ligase